MTTEPAAAPANGRLTEVAWLASDATGRQVVSIHVKSTYDLLPNGRCVPAAEPVPLLIPAAEGADAEIRETDVTPVKVGTDFIVIGSAHAPRPGTRDMTVRVRLGQAQWAFAISGNRRCARRSTGALAFSEPETFQTIPLRYENAYGGFDESVPAPPIKVILDAFASHPGVYPRNPAGRGYVVRPQSPALDSLILPNVEHPSQRLTPDNLVVGAPERWWKQPIPWSCDWFDKTWYPRLTFFGGLPDHVPDDDRGMHEVRTGLVQRGQKARHAALRLKDAIDARFASAASPAMVIPHPGGPSC